MDNARIRSTWRRHDGRPRARAAVLTGGVIAITMAPIGVAATGEVLREGQRNGTATRETKIVSRVPATSASTGGYTTRQSNTSSSGGGAIYGCRSGAGGTGANPPQEPCLRANNLSNGHAFEFAARDGEVAGTITVGSGGDTRRPFTTNATGVATGLNADRVDGKDAAQLLNEAVAAAPRTRWFLLDERGEIVEQSGGFKVVEAYGADENVYVDTGSSLEGHGLGATIAMREQGDTDADPLSDAGTSGEVAIARCQTPALVCPPEAARNVNTLVVSPRNSDGSATAGTPANPRKRVYVTVAP